MPATRRRRIRERLRELGVTVNVVEGAERSYLEVSGDDLPVRSLFPGHWEGVAEVIPLSPPYPHAAWGGGRGELARPTLVEVAGVPVGAGHFAVVAGPCALEEESRAIDIARAVKDGGARLFRGGAFKPRTSPYAFQGLEDEGLQMLRRVRESTGLPIVTEVMEGADLDKVAACADLLQVGSRSMHNYALLKRLSHLRTPVLLKRGLAATVEELLLAAEYLLSGGNTRVILCERGIRHAAGARQVILDLGAIPEIRRRTHLPVIVDPSHGSGAAYLVAPLARAAAAAGADGLMIEVHDDPERALSDGRQALRPAEFAALMEDVRAILGALGPDAPSPPSAPPPSPAIAAERREPAGKDR
ncbi:MAG: 3-deoxy-7-phosphoheptulonate synthase [Planctomycetota bacterium]